MKLAMISHDFSSAPEDVFNNGYPTRNWVIKMQKRTKII